MSGRYTFDGCRLCGGSGEHRQITRVIGMDYKAVQSNGRPWPEEDRPLWEGVPKDLDQGAKPCPLCALIKDRADGWYYSWGKGGAICRIWEEALEAAIADLKEEGYL